MSNFVFLHGVAGLPFAFSSSLSFFDGGDA